MVSLTLPAQQSKLDDYGKKALATRMRRQAKGFYQRPTKEQRDAYSKMMRRGGRQSLTVREMGLLATHPYLAASQRAEFAQMAQAAIESAVR